MRWSHVKFKPFSSIIIISSFSVHHHTNKLLKSNIEKTILFSSNRPNNYVIYVYEKKRQNML